MKRLVFAFLVIYCLGSIFLEIKGIGVLIGRFFINSHWAKAMDFALCFFWVYASLFVTTSLAMFFAEQINRYEREK